MDFSPRRVLLFALISALVLISWNSFVVNPMQQAQQAVKQREAAEAEQAKAEKAKAAKKAKPADAGKAKRPGHAPAIAEKAAPPKPAKGFPEIHPRKEVVLGSLDEDSGYFQEVLLTTKGATVWRIELNDKRYRDLDDPAKPLALVNPVDGKTGEGERKTFRTFATSFPEIDGPLSVLGLPPLDAVDWKVIEPKKPDKTKVTFEYVVPHAFRIRKEFKLNPPLENSSSNEVRDTKAEGYFLTLAITVQNLQAEKAEVHYELQGPVGMPLEDAESTRKFRDIKLGTLADGKIKDKSLTAKDLVKAIDSDKVEEWAAPFKYVGVDGQFFATLLYNGTETETSKTIEQYVPQAIRVDKEDPQKSDLSVLFTSKPIELAPKETSGSQEYVLYSGPKRQALLNQMDAGDVLEFGWFAVISKGMLWILSVLHHTLLLPYGLAIIGLTIMVRAALFPLSKKQALSAARMKELQPRLKELKARYGDDKQKFAQAQMELFRDTGYNPFAGCLPVLFQMPIFFGLYSALGHAVDLRAAEFLWVKNLAAPDQLFRWPGGFRLPFLGHFFNLLPLVTVVLFLLQQKMFMPSPDPEDEQAVMQHKIMNFMMIGMGVMFYHVPAGLCIYFIASSLWGIGERKLLDYAKNDADEFNNGGSGSAAKTSANGGLFKTVTQNGRDKAKNSASKKRGKQSKSRR